VTKTLVQIAFQIGTKTGAWRFQSHAVANTLPVIISNTYKRKLYKELHNLYSSSNTVTMIEIRMRRAVSVVSKRLINAYIIYIVKPEVKTECRRLHMNETITLKWALKNKSAGEWTGSDKDL
jgi:hypothetical protein